MTSLLSHTINPIKFASRFFFLWNAVLLITLFVVVFFSLYLGQLIDRGFPVLRTSKAGISLLLLGPLFFNLGVAFAITFYFFKRAYSRLTAAISPIVSHTASSREILKTWALCYWFVPLALMVALGFGVLTGGRLNHRGLAVTIYPVAIFLVSFPVYLRLKYLARARRAVAK